MRPLIGVGFLAALSCLLACGGANHSVTAPSPIPPNPPPGPPTATLGVSTFTAAVRFLTMNSFGYAVKLRLSETGGTSGATLTKLVLSALPGGDADYGCGPPMVRIDPGGTWDMASLGYCALEPTSSYQASSLVVSVGFTDDDGRVGSIEATAIVIKP
jgi:hypothetical protein